MNPALAAALDALAAAHLRLENAVEGVKLGVHDRATSNYIDANLAFHAAVKAVLVAWAAQQPEISSAE